MALPATFLKRLVWANVLVILLIANLVMLTLYRSYENGRERAEITTQNMARVLEQHIAAIIDKTDVALRSVILEVSRQKAQGGIRTDDLNQFLAQQQSLQPELTSLRIADAQGSVRFGVSEADAARFSTADREYFIRARDNPQAGVVMGAPVLSRITGKWTLFFARRLNGPDGAFAGIVFAGITTDYFQSLLARLTHDQHWALALRTEGLHLIARHPWGEGVAAAIGGTAVTAALQQKLQTHAAMGTYLARSVLDGIEHQYAYSRFARYPLYAVAGLATANLWREWWQEALEVSLLAVLVILVQVGASGLLYRAWKYRYMADTEQKRLNRTLQLLNESNFALLHADHEERLLPDICRLIVEEGGYLMAWAGLAERDVEKTVRPVAAAGHEDGYLDRVRISWADTARGRGPTGTAIRSGKTQICQNVLANPNLAPWRDEIIRRGYQSSIGLPLINDGIVVGALTIYATEANAFGAEEVGLLEKLANNLSFGIEGLRARNQLEIANKELQGFTYAASHDMKGPLGRIANFSALLEKKYRERLEGDGLVFLDFIKQNALRLTVLIEDLLAHAQLDERIAQAQALDLRGAVQGALAERRDDIREAGAEIRLDLPDTLLYVNPSGLAQVLRNLLENALKYSAQATPPVIEIGGRVEAGVCCLWVRDNGIGFDMVHHDQIFDIFRRLHTYGEFPGSGIGLALVKKAMEGMDGRVWADSTPGQGATFFLELPCLREAYPETGMHPGEAPEKP